MQQLEICYEILKTAYNKKALDLMLLDVTGKSDISDFQVICSSSNEVHSKAIADAIESRIRDVYHMKPFCVEGRRTGQWVLMDYGSILVHIFLQEFRDVYAIERLWPDSEVAIDHILT